MALRLGSQARKDAFGDPLMGKVPMLRQSRLLKQPLRPVLNFGFGAFVLVSDLEFRASNFDEQDIK
jgi:hypothetical protein